MDDTDSQFDARSLAALVAMLLLALVDNQILSPILKEIAGSFGVTVGSVGATVSGYAVAAAGAALVVGPLSDAWSRKPFLVAAALVFALGSTLTFYSSSLSMFALARFLTGIAAGIISVLVVAWIADRVPYHRRGRAMGWVAASYFAAPILFMPLVSAIADRVGWRALYLGFLIVAVSLGLAVSAFLIEPVTFDRRQEKRALGWLSALRGYGDFLRHRATLAGAVSAFFVSGGITAFILYLGAYLGTRFGLSVSSIGLVFLLSGTASLIGAVGAGRFSDRVGKRGVAIGGSLALAFLLLVVPVLGSLTSLYVVLALIGLAAAARVAPLQSLITELVTSERRGAFIAMRNFFSQLGIALSAWAGGFLYSWGGYAFVCYLASVFSFGAVVLLLVIQEPAPSSPAGVDDMNRVNARKCVEPERPS